MPKDDGARPGWPAVEAPRLASISAAFTRRRKAIRHQTRTFTVERSFDEVDGVDFQRLDVYAARIGGQSVHLVVWDDGQAWVHTCQPAKRGWVFRYTVEPDLEDVDAAEVVRRFEESLRLAFRASRGDDIVESFGALWDAPVAYRR